MDYNQNYRASSLLYLGEANLSLEYGKVFAFWHFENVNLCKSHWVKIFSKYSKMFGTCL